jgi:hypothetical protein
MAISKKATSDSHWLSVKPSHDVASTAAPHDPGSRGSLPPTDGIGARQARKLWRGRIG